MNRGRGWGCQRGVGGSEAALRIADFGLRIWVRVAGAGEAGKHEGEVQQSGGGVGGKSLGGVGLSARRTFKVLQADAF